MKSKILLLLLPFLLLFSCGNNVKSQHNNNQESSPKKEATNATSSEDNQKKGNGKVPKKAYDVLKYVREHGEAMPNYVGGRTFQNREKRLPISNDKGKKIRYQEWDVNPKINGQNRGAERLITSEVKAYYTKDHYKTFIEIE